MSKNQALVLFMEWRNGIMKWKMKLGKGLTAWVLAGVVAVSSVQFPVSRVYAEEAGTESDKMTFETDTVKNESESDMEETFENNVLEESELWSEVKEEDAENTEKEHQTSVAEDQEEPSEEDCKETTIVEQATENEELSEELGGSDSVEVEEVAEDSNNIVLSGNCGEHVTFVLDSDGVLTISGSGDMSDYSYNYNQGAPWKKSLVKIISISKGVTSIGDFAFYNCSGLTNVTIPESVTSIGYSAFYDCSGLTNVTIPESVTSIGDFAFYGCSGLTSAGSIGGGYDYEFGWKDKIPDNAFCGCSRLTSVTMPESVTSIGDAVFHHCIGLTNVAIPESVTSIGFYAFEDCWRLTNVTIPESVTSIGSYAFYGCSGLINVFYGGNEEDWAKISVGSDNFALTNATIHYNSNKSAGNISTFTLSRTATGAVNDTINISGEITLSDDIEASSDTLQKEIDNIQWTTSDKEIAEVTKCNGLNAMDNRSASLMVYVTAYKEGTVTITGTTSNGLAKSCKVTVTEKGSGDEESDITLRHITGELKEVNLNLSTVTIDNVEYAVTDTFSISDAYKILLDSKCKTVVAILADNKVSRMDSVMDIPEAQVSLAVNPVALSYQDGSFDKTELEVTVSLTCGAKAPYRNSDLQGTEAEDTSVDFSEYGLSLPDGLQFNSKSTEFSKKVSSTVKFGQKQDYKHTIYIKDSYVPNQVKQSLSIRAVAVSGNHSVDGTVKLNVANIDRQKEIAAEKTSETSKLVSEADALLDKITFALSPDTMQMAGYTKKQQEYINAIVKTWIADILANEVLRQDTGDDSIWAEFCKEAGYSESQKKKFIENITKKAFKKIGLDISPIINSGSLVQWQEMSASTTIKVYQEDEKNYDTITVNLDFGNLAFTGSQSFTGMGNINFSIKTVGNKTYSGVGVVTFADLDQFAEGVERICKSEIKQIYNLDIGSNIDKGTNWIRKQINASTTNKIIEKLTSDTVNKIAEKKFGKFSNNVFEVHYKALTKSTKGSVHCPVDVYIYDSQGTLCGSVIDNQIDTDNGDIFLYCTGDEKYFNLTGDDYTIKFVGNDEGAMTYQIDEYLGTELLRSIYYESIPLADGKTYLGTIPYTQMQDSEIYNPVEMENAEAIKPTSDTLVTGGDGDEKPDETYTVTFDIQGHGTALEEYFRYTEIKKGSTINSPTSPQEEGYTFTGWYKDADCTILWDFATDIVTSDTTLYAGWKAIDDKPFIGDVLPEDIPVDGKIPDGLWIAGVKDYYTYTGIAIKPEVRVYDSNRLLKAGQDYNISYKNNIKANDASKESTAPAVIIKGKGNYAGTEKETFKILSLDLNDTSIIAEDMTVVYNKKVQKKVPVVTYSGKKLANNKDFTVSYPDKGTDAYKAAGTYNILLTAKQGGNFTGARTVRFTITNNALISGAVVRKISNQTYTGKAIEPELEVTMKKVSLIKNVDYTVTYINNIESGTAIAILTGIGKYAGTKKVTFKINGTSLKGAVVSGITDKIYSGIAQEQKITVTLNNKLLTENTDYEVIYSQNTNAGKATVTIKGIRAYSGTVKKTFKITAYDMKENTGNQIGGMGKEITAKYLKGGSKPKLELTFAGKKLKEGTDYTVSCQNNKVITTANTKNKPTMTIKGKGNFKGSLTKTFTITSKALNDIESPVTLTVADKGFVDKAGKYISVPVLTDADGKKLVAGKDYESVVVYTLENGTELTKKSKVNVGTKIKVKVTGKGAYMGELEGFYQITPNDFNKAKISISPQTYTGKAVTLDKDSVTVKIGKETLTFGTDYEIVENSYANNVKKGTASVTIVGKGNYGGTKAVRFKITARKFSWFWRLFR